MTINGLKSEIVEEQRQRFGSNKLTQLEPESLWDKIIEGFED